MKYWWIQRTVLLGLIFLTASDFAQQSAAASQQTPTQLSGSAHNVVVYREHDRYAAWPANHGIWSWGNEIVVGFESGYFKEQKERHSIDWDRPAEHLLARSVDDG